MSYNVFVVHEHNIKFLSGVLLAARLRNKRVHVRVAPLTLARPQKCHGYSRALLMIISTQHHGNVYKRIKTKTSTKQHLVVFAMKTLCLT